MDSPKIKYFKTSFGKKTMFNGKGITFTEKEGVVIKTMLNNIRMSGKL